MHYDHQFHRCCPAQQAPPDQFSFFQRLPAEIRNMIWEYSLPEARVYEVLDAPSAKQKTPAQQGLMFANVHPEPPPALAAVCRESRYFVLHHYKPLTLGTTTKYVDLSRDILLLEPYLLVKRLHRTLHFMSQIPLVRDNINRLALGTSYGVYTGICHPVLSWRVSKNNMGKLLSTLAKFPKLKMLIFVVHQEFQFEFDFRFPMPNSAGGPAPAPSGYLSPISSIGSPLGGSGPASLAPFSGGAPPRLSSASGLPSPPASSPLSRPLSTTPPAPGAAFPQQLSPSPSPSLGPGPSPHAPAGFNTQHQNQPGAQQGPRPQLVHQAYRFKFDIEANINHTPRRPHLNELLYYPLDIDEDKDDWDLGDLGGDGGGGEWCDPWPTNDDWRRFRKRFQRAMHLSLEMNLVEGQGQDDAARGAEYGSGGSSGGPAWWGGVRGDYGRDGDDGHVAKKRKMQVPALKGASLLWRYTRGGYV
ncbi:hypothetical protein QBC47DRAFT_312173 [Echria macrotheca]|uniref:2EXR domain-containing protein n=1 Tax=Echria macrotheca TaxID=438768 RepID=A0AAJ0B2R7_9PEZI|nr:hypothetical protein QBC47DRAFT_312173 [Echria macrotheca]